MGSLKKPVDEEPKMKVPEQPVA